MLCMYPIESLNGIPWEIVRNVHFWVPDPLNLKLWSWGPEMDFFFRWTLACCPGWSAVAQSQLTTTSASQVQVILLPQPPE